MLFRYSFVHFSRLSKPPDFYYHLHILWHIVLEVTEFGRQKLGSVVMIKNQKDVDRLLSAKIPSGETFIEEYVVGNLGLSIRKGKRSATWYLMARNKRKKRIKLGSAEEISLKKARNLVLEFDQHDEPVTDSVEIDFSKITVRKYLDEVYLPRYMKADGKKPWNYRQAQNFDEQIMDRPVMSLKRSDIEVYVERRTSKNALQGRHVAGKGVVLKDVGRKVSRVTAKRDYAALSAIISKGVADGHFLYNPIAGVKIRAAEGKKGRGLTNEELEPYEAALPTIENLRLKCFLMIAKNTGARSKEILTLRVNNVHLFGNNPSIVVEESYSKSGKTRELPLSDMTRQAIFDYMNSDYFVKDSESQNQYLFYNKRTKTHVQSMYKTFQTWAENYGEINELPYIKVHGWRHTFAIQAHEELPMAAVRDLMGHSSIQVTDGYLQSSKTEQARGVSALDRKSEARRRRYMGESAYQLEQAEKQREANERLEKSIEESQRFFSKESDQD